MAELLKNRFRGALIGALVGDCYGAPFERKKAKPKIKEHIERMSKDTTSPPLRYTDDTVMSIDTCESLIYNKGIDPTHMAREFSESFFKEPRRGYGPAVRTVFRRLRRAKYKDPYGPGATQFDGQGSFGNGAAMRCVGIGLFANKKHMDITQTVELAESCSRITHSHAHGMNGASLLVLAVKYVLEQPEDSLDESTFLHNLLDEMRQLEDGELVYAEKLRSIMRLLDTVTESGKHVANQSEIVKLLGNDIAAQNSVPLAIYSFLRGISKFSDSYEIGDDFTRTLHWAISCGGDTDTIASMACGLCGAYLGINKISQELYNKCEAYQDILALADRMFDFQK